MAWQVKASKCARVKARARGCSPEFPRRNDHEDEVAPSGGAMGCSGRNSRCSRVGPTQRAMQHLLRTIARQRRLASGSHLDSRHRNRSENTFLFENAAWLAPCVRQTCWHGRRVWCAHQRRRYDLPAAGAAHSVQARRRRRSRCRRSHLYTVGAQQRHLLGSQPACAEPKLFSLVDLSSTGQPSTLTCQLCCTALLIVGKQRLQKRTSKVRSSCAGATT